MKAAREIWSIILDRDTMILLHRTGSKSAEDILKNGFVDRPAYTELADVAGVWLSDRPLTCNEGANGDVLLELQFALQEADPADLELVEDASRIGNGACQLRLSIEQPVAALLIPTRTEDAPVRTASLKKSR